MSDAEKDMVKKENSPSGDSDAVVPSLKKRSRKRTTMNSNNITEETIAVPSSVAEPKSKRTKTGNKKIVKKELSNEEINDIVTKIEVDHDGGNKTKDESNSKPKRKLGAWTPEEDRLLLESLEKIAGEGKWKRVSEIMNNGRNNDNCRHRFNLLKNQLVKGIHPN